MFYFSFTTKVIVFLTVCVCLLLSLQSLWCVESLAASSAAFLLSKFSFSPGLSR